MARSSRSFSRSSGKYGSGNHSHTSHTYSNAHPHVAHGHIDANQKHAHRDIHASSNPYSRSNTQETYSKQRKKGKRKKIALVAVCIVLVLVLGGAGTALAYLGTIQSNLHSGLDMDEMNAALADEAYAGEPFYMLLMGVDGSKEREQSAQYAGDTFRSDSMILVRVDPENQKVTMVSLHRDTQIDMGEYGTQKLNAAHALGGSAYAVEVVSEFAGVPISHYAEINFDAFKDIVDALGGVEVDVPMEINDERAGGHLDAGLQTLNGDQALILSRSRHSYDAYGDGDRFRAANQRLLLSAIAKKILSSDVPTMLSTIEALSKYVTTDLELTEIVGYAQALRGMDVDEDIYSAMEPTTAEYVNNTWYENVDQAAWDEMMRRVDQGLPPTEETEIDPNSGAIMANAGDGTVDTSGANEGDSSSSRRR